MATNLLEVTVRTPKKQIFQGHALAVSSTNSSGKFDILAEHANFITIVQNQPLEILTDGKMKVVFSFSQAIIYNSNNKVIVYADPATPITETVKG